MTNATYMSRQEANEVVSIALFTWSRGKKEEIDNRVLGTTLTKLIVYIFRKTFRKGMIL
jgi:hypothetical protein